VSRQSPSPLVPIYNVKEPPPAVPPGQRPKSPRRPNLAPAQVISHATTFPSNCFWNILNFHPACPNGFVIRPTRGRRPAEASRPPIPPETAAGRSRIVPGAHLATVRAKQRAVGRVTPCAPRAAPWLTNYRWLSWRTLFGAKQVLFGDADCYWPATVNRTRWLVVGTLNLDPPHFPLLKQGMKKNKQPVPPTDANQSAHAVLQRVINQTPAKTDGAQKTISPAAGRGGFLCPKTKPIRHVAQSAS